MRYERGTAWDFHYCSDTKQGGAKYLEVGTICWREKAIHGGWLAAEALAGVVSGRE